MKWNDHEVKYLRHRTLTMVDAAHLHGCPGCAAFLKEHYEQNMYSHALYSILDELDMNRRPALQISEEVAAFLALRRRLLGGPPEDSGSTAGEDGGTGEG